MPDEPDRTETVTVAEGGFDLPVWLPPAGRGPGLVVLHEIYGTSNYICAVARRLAQLGYVAAVPDLFWRFARNWRAEHTEEGLAASLEVSGRLDAAGAVSDAAAALDHLDGLAQTTDGCGVIGFCLGGSLAYFVAAEASPAVAVSYYGSAVPDAVEAMDRITAPLQLQFGGNDGYIPREAVDRVAAEAANHANVEFLLHEQAGHAFHNDRAPMFHEPEAATAAWSATRDFLARHLPAR
jgi:carboxymethylenebutenolidase